MEYKEKFKNFVFHHWPIMFILFLVLSLLGRTLLPAQTKVIYGGDLLAQFYFWKGYLVESFKSGFLPFWNPYNFSGAPFLAHPSVAFFYPATTLFFFLPLNLAFSLNYFLHLLIAGWGMYWLSRKYIDTFSSLIASSVFVLSGFFAARIYAGHFDLLTTSIWIPLVFGSVKEVLETGSKQKIVKAVVFLSLQILAGYQAYVLFTIEFVFAYTIFYLIKHRLFKWQSIKTKIFPILSVVCFSVAITSISWLSTWQFTKLSIRGKGLPYELTSWGSLPVSGLKLFFQPLNREELNKISYSLGGGPLLNPFDHFVGRLPIIVIFIFLILKISQFAFPKKKKIFRVNPDFWFFLIYSVFLLWVSFARFMTPNLHYFLYLLIPFYRYIRIPLQHLIYLVVLVPLMAGIVISLLRKNILKLSLLALFIFELFTFSSKYIFLTEIPEQTYDKKLLTYLQSEVKNERVLPYFRVISPALQAMDLNSTIKYKIESTSGYDPVILGNYYRFIDLVNKAPSSSIFYYNVEIPLLKLNPDIINYLNIGYVLTEKSNGWESQGLPSSLKLIFESNLYKLYKNKDILPRFFLVNNARIYSSKLELEDRLVRGDFDFSKSVALIKNDLGSLSDFDLQCRQSNLGDVQVVSRTPNFILLRINALCNSFLSSSEVYYPGWRAKVDGSPTKMYLSNFSFRSIYVPKGVHKVEFYYQPNIYYIGGVISIVGIFLLIYFFKKR